MDAPEIQYTTTSDGVSIAYFDVGSGQPLIFMPNLPYSHVQLEWQLEPWCERLAGHCRLIRYDGRGNGFSERIGEDLSADALRRDLDAVVAAIGVDRFALLGMLHACLIAIRYANDYPEQLSTLFLWQPYARASDFLEKPYNSTFAEALRYDFDMFSDLAAGQLFGWDEAEQMVKWGGYVLPQASTAEATLKGFPEPVRLFAVAARASQSAGGCEQRSATAGDDPRLPHRAV